MRFEGMSETKKNNNYVKIEDGKPVTGVFMGDEITWYVHWIDRKPIVCNFKKTGICELCDRLSFDKDKKAKSRFKVNFIVQENGAFVAKIMEQGYGVYNQLKDLQNAGYNLEQQLITVSKNTNGGRTSYSVLPAPNGSLGKVQCEQLKQVTLHKLELPKAKQETPTKAWDDSDPGPQDENAPW